MLRTIPYTTHIPRPSPEAAYMLLKVVSQAVTRTQSTSSMLDRLAFLMVSAEPETYPGFEFAFWLVRRYNPWCSDIYEEVAGAARHRDAEKSRADLTKWLDNVKRLLHDGPEPLDERDLMFLDNVLYSLEV